MAVTNVGNSDTFTSMLPSDREVTLTRLFAAPDHHGPLSVVGSARLGAQHRDDRGAAISYDRLEDLVRELQQS
jgi:hypothetical protein